jgi:[ribosomal protein S5]-alanine N-acetyltransferase
MHLATERLLLREFTGADWPAVLAYQSDARYLRYYPWNERSEQDVRAFVQHFVGWQAEQPRTRFQLAITLKGLGASPNASTPAAGKEPLIGNCGVRLPGVGASEGELGYELSPAYWGHGYATEAARAMLSLAFRELGLHRVSAWCVAENAASVRVLEKLDLRLEGRLREREWIKGRWYDTLIYAVLEHEWRP